MIGVVNPDPIHPIAGDKPKDWHRFAKSLNPLNFWERREAISLSLKDSEFEDRVHAIVPIPRPSVNLKRANQFLPPKPRRFVLAQKWNDEVEEWKTERYHANGDTTLTIAQAELPRLASLGDGNLIRSMIHTAIGDWKALVPENSVPYLESVEFEDRVRSRTEKKSADFIRDFLRHHPYKDLASQILDQAAVVAPFDQSDAHRKRNELIQFLLHPRKDLGSTRIVLLPNDLASRVEKLSTSLFIRGRIEDRVSVKRVDADTQQIELSDNTCRVILRELRE